LKRRPGVISFGYFFFGQAKKSNPLAGAGAGFKTSRRDSDTLEILLTLPSPAGEGFCAWY
ncbi:MAG: hypothetical protein ACXV7F_09125, partial [Methylomonas sp.]